MALTEIPKKAINTVASGRNYVDDLANKYIVKPKSTQGIAGFIFDFEEEAEVTLQADITDHYVEDNTTVNDHIAIKPKKITLRGFASELVFEKPKGIQGALQFLQNKLNLLPSYIGDYTSDVQQKIQGIISAAQTATTVIDNAITRTQNIIGLFDKSSPAPTKQQKAYQQLENAWRTKQIFTVETPYEYFPNMAIESVTFMQGNDKFNSDVRITLKQFRFVETILLSPNEVNFSGRGIEQRQTQIDKGKTKGTNTNPSILRTIFAGG